MLYQWTSPEATDALAAADLRQDLPTLYDGVKSMIRDGYSPEQVQRAAQKSGATDTLAAACRAAAQHLQRVL